MRHIFPHAMGATGTLEPTSPARPRRSVSTAAPGEGPALQSARRPRALVISSTFPAPSETFVIDHVAGLARAGWDVFVAAKIVDRDLLARVAVPEGIAARTYALSVRDHRRPASRVRTAAAMVLRYGTSYLRIIRCPAARSAVHGSAMLHEVAERVRPDVMHAHFGPNGMMASLVARRLATPLIVDFHGYDVTSLPREHGWDGYRHLLSTAVAVVHSRFVEARVRQHLEMPVVRIPLGVDPALFVPRSRGSVWPQPLMFLTVGRLTLQKGHHVAVETLALFRHRYPTFDARLRICGAGPMEALLRQRVRQLGVQPYVTFTGPLCTEDVAREMRAADVLLVPSQPQSDGSQEAFCRVAVEGMASGLAVVGSDIGGLGETIGDGGSLTDPSAAAFVATIGRLLESSTPRKVMARAVDRAREFTLTAMWKQYDEVARATLRG
jgi:colanic acid/amylovoran biosynthesis glycosyltransferase